MNSYTSTRTRELVTVAIFIAIIILQSWVPALGYIMLPTISLTIIHITVIIASILVSTRAGILIGFVWGVNSLLRAIFTASPVERLIFQSPFVSILPRMIMPFIIGLLAAYLYKKNMQTPTIGLITGLLGSLLNTILVLGAIGLFKGADFAAGNNINMDQLWPFLGAAVMANGIPEAILSAILTPILLIALERFGNRKRLS
ncbi:ECF transporter S component [Eremococcus coleocola]|nr:ECF transporter S component [Eremococcus coleocola]